MKPMPADQLDPRVKRVWRINDAVWITVIAACAAAGAVPLSLALEARWPLVALAAGVFAVFVNGAQGWIQLYLAIQNGEVEVSPLPVVGGVLLGFALLVGAFIGVYALAWRNMSYVFDEREFSYHSGIITKRRVHAQHHDPPA